MPEVIAVDSAARHRKDMGDLTPLAASIRQERMPQPIGVMEKLHLVFA